MKSTLLVVDDEPVARQSLTDLLKLEGFSVTSAPNGQSAVEYIRTHAVDLMIVDLKMPGMDGLEVIQVVSQISVATEIILLTAYGSVETAIQALRLRIHDYLLKPAFPEQIIASVNKGLSRRMAKTRPSPLPSSEVEPVQDVFSLKDGTVVDLPRRQIQSKNKVEHLTPAEGRLLRIFMENKDRVFSHRELVLLVQGYDTTQREAPEILRPLVSRLRHKLNQFPFLSRKLVSVRGTGYLYEGDQ